MPSQEQAQPGEINGDFVDRFTFVHFGTGFCMGLTPAPWWSVPIVAVGWEIAENPAKDRFPEFFPHSSHDTLSNAVVDGVAFCAGAVVGRALRRVFRSRSS